MRNTTSLTFLGTGLAVSGSANNSGPYSNITFDTGGSSGLPATVCASINGVEQHTCKSLIAHDEAFAIPKMNPA